jgi:four helix bundle protein
MSFKDFTELPVWQKSSELLFKMYHITKGFPDDEQDGMSKDLRYAANNTTNHIAEGYGTYDRPDKTKYYKLSRANAYRIINLVMAAYKLNFLNEGHYTELMDGYKRVVEELDSLIKSLEIKKPMQQQHRPPENRKRYDYNE